LLLLHLASNPHGLLTINDVLNLLVEQKVSLLDEVGGIGDAPIGSVIRSAIGFHTSVGAPHQETLVVPSIVHYGGRYWTIDRTFELVFSLII